MGRGRAKAKQTKVARELKYNPGSMDINRLKAELASDPVRPAPPVDDDESDDYEDPYADIYNDEDDEDAPRPSTR
ncbi:MAG: hypothetical protein JWM48_609 [Mycobacterium sp.]|jgi:hypothetical protein|nr:hypothetical protein [Mycobacterium sp.]